MIRLLTEQDKSMCLSFVKQKPAENLFIIGDIEAFGMDTEFQTLWGEFNESNELIAVLLKFHSNYIPYAPGDFDAKGFAAIINADPSCHEVSGLKEVTEQLVPYLQKTASKRQLHYAKCTKLVEDIQPDMSLVAFVHPSQAKDLLELLAQIPEFKNAAKTTVEQKKNDLANGFSRTTYIANEKKEMVASASTTAENSASAMIIGVATREDAKRKGYATACMFKLCQGLFQEGKEACLFYDNPSAGSIYKRIGFKDIGFWMMYTF